MACIIFYQCIDFRILVCVITYVVALAHSKYRITKDFCIIQANHQWTILSYLQIILLFAGKFFQILQMLSVIFSTNSNSHTFLIQLWSLLWLKGLEKSCEITGHFIGCTKLIDLLNFKVIHVPKFENTSS